MLFDRKIWKKKLCVHSEEQENEILVFPIFPKNKTDEKTDFSHLLRKYRNTSVIIIADFIDELLIRNVKALKCERILKMRIK